VYAQAVATLCGRLPYKTWINANQLFGYKDLNDAVPFLFEEKFGALAKNCLEAAEVLKRTMATQNSRKHFR